MNSGNNPKTLWIIGANCYSWFLKLSHYSSEQEKCFFFLFILFWLGRVIKICILWSWKDTDSEGFLPEKWTHFLTIWEKMHSSISVATDTKLSCKCHLKQHRIWSVTRTAEQSEKCTVPSPWKSEFLFVKNLPVFPWGSLMCTAHAGPKTW